jgi:hypothetical protein
MRWATSPDHGARNIHNGSKPEGLVVIAFPKCQVHGADCRPFRCKRQTAPPRSPDRLPTTAGVSPPERLILTPRDR